MLKITILTLFPEMFPGVLGCSIAGKALEVGQWALDVVNIRDFAQDKHKSVDDTPYGGGAGMVMRADVISAAIENTCNRSQNPKIIYMSPRGKPLTQPKVNNLAQEEHLLILCGRYEGVDQRVLDEYNIEEISIGDYVLSGGEIAAMVLVDACVRRIPGVLGNDDTHSEESFGSGEYADLLEYPHYTKPAEWRGRKVPDILLSGNHAEIAKWRLEQAKSLTRKRRPDLAE